MIQKPLLTVETDPLVGVILNMCGTYLMADSKKVVFMDILPFFFSDGMFSGGTGRAGERGQSVDHDVTLCFPGREQLGA